MSGLWMERCGHVGTGMGQQPPHASGIPESVGSHTGTHIQLRCWALAWECAGPVTVTLRCLWVGGRRAVGATGAGAGHRGALCGQPASQPCSPHPRTAEPVKPHGWEGICARWAGGLRECTQNQHMVTSCLCFPRVTETEKGHAGGGCDPLLFTVSLLITCSGVGLFPWRC